MVVDDIDNLNYDSLEAVAHLRASDRYREIMQVGHCSLKLFTACVLPGLHLVGTFSPVEQFICIAIICTISNSNSHMHGVLLQRVKDALEGKEENNRVWTGPSEEDPTYRLLVDCNQLAVDIDNEIGIIHNFMRDKYRLKFPELESLVHHPIDYARVVQAIGMSSNHVLQTDYLNPC